MVPGKDSLIALATCRCGPLRYGVAPEWRPLLGIGFVCAGVMRAIPEAEREKMPLLIDYANSQAPFIAPFSWGEQGYFPGVGYKHGNLLTSFLVIGEKEPR